MLVLWRMSGEKGKWTRGGMFDGVNSVAVRNLHVRNSTGVCIGLLQHHCAGVSVVDFH